MEDFSQYTIKDYSHWSVQIHLDQSYLGRCVIWCRRADAGDLADTTPDEQSELFEILKDVRTALSTVFQAEWFNYSFLGNETRHLHGHLLPRYSSPREFAGVTFTDERWGHNPYRGAKREFETTPATLEAIKARLKEALG